MLPDLDLGGSFLLGLAVGLPLFAVLNLLGLGVADCDGVGCLMRIPLPETFEGPGMDAFREG